MTDSDGARTPGDPPLVDWLREQLGLYDRLQSLADKQHVLVREEDTQPLLRLLAERQKLTRRLSELQDRVRPYQNRWSEVRTMLPPGERAVAEDLLRESRGRLRRLLDGDEEDARMLRLRKERVGEELGAVRSTKRAMDAYRAASGGRHSGRLDRMHES